MIKDRKLRKELTMYRLSEHSLAIETGRRRQTWLPREARLCSHCELSVVETELLFLTECPRYDSIRKEFYEKVSSVCSEFQLCSDSETAVRVEREERADPTRSQIRDRLSQPEGQPVRNTKHLILIIICPEVCLHYYL
ncbi:hypothetical protein MHYP_G00205110, partial [Metynnis hypsauchen]